MASFRRILLSRWSYSLLGTALLCGIAWFLGPLLPWLEDWPPRLAAMAAMLAAWGGVNALIGLRRRICERALASGVTAGGSSEAAEERAAVEAKITTALGLLKRARGTRGYLYEQPWYAIIGPPGAGKTTALLNAELEFPLAAAMGRGAVAGVGGTRLCEWWFTGQAVLIDTAGRYTTQDSDAAVDRAGWEAFLDLLKRTRPRQPLNGVIIAIALSDVAQASPAERGAHARTIRQRINELEGRFGMRLPVYAVFTKADLLAGFMEFFDDLDRDGRRQVWGATFPLGSAAAGGFAAEFRVLAERLGNRLVDRLQAEANPERRALIAAFPTQLASLEAVLTGFVTEAFGESNASESSARSAAMLRGTYFTSATQEGTPIDRLTGAIARSFGLSPQRVARLRPQAGRSYFLTRLLHDVVFNEAMLVNAGRRRRGALMRWAGVAAALLLVIVASGGLWREYTAGQNSIAAAAAALAGYERATTGLPLDPVADADLASLAPLLDQAAAALPAAAAVTGWWSVFSQAPKLAAARRALYRHALDYALFPRLIWRLEAQLRGNLNNPEFLYEATRVYLMLGGEGPLDRDLVREWMTLGWQAAYPDAVAAPLRASLGRHLEALLADPLPAIVLDGELVAQARATFGLVSLAQRVYSRIRPSPAARGLPPWRPSDALGAAGGVVFMRASGRPLDDGVPGFYTVEGFHTVLLPALGDAAQQVASESWVLGEKLKLDPQSGQMRALQHDVIALYEADYAKTWDAMLSDLSLVPLRSLVQAAQDLYIVSSEHSPMRSLLASIARQLTLSATPDAERQPGTSAQAARVSDARTRLEPLLGATPEITAAAPGHEIDERYQALRELVAADAGARLDRLMQTVAELQQQLAKLAAAGVRAGPPPAAAGDDPVIALRMEAQRQPQPVTRWLTTMADSGIALRGGDARQQVIAAYNAANGPAALCAAAVNGHYPFAPLAPSETSLDDFARLFAPGGVLDGFFNTLLKPYVDTKAAVWKPLSIDGVAPPNGVTPAIAAVDVAQFQRAAQIRDLFFADGRATPNIRFDITPVSLDSRAKQVTLDLGGTVVTYSRDVPRATEITWPGNGTGTARLSFAPPPASGADGWQETGGWATFRLFGHAKQLGDPVADRLRLGFRLADRQAVFDLSPGARTPMVAAILQAFHCPTIQ